MKVALTSRPQQSLTLVWIQARSRWIKLVLHLNLVHKRSTWGAKNTSIVLTVSISPLMPQLQSNASLKFTLIISKWQIDCKPYLQRTAFQKMSRIIKNICNIRLNAVTSVMIRLSRGFLVDMDMRGIIMATVSQNSDQKDWLFLELVAVELDSKICCCKWPMITNYSS